MAAGCLISARQPLVPLSPPPFAPLLLPLSPSVPAGHVRESGRPAPKGRMEPQLELQEELLPEEPQAVRATRVRARMREREPAAARPWNPSPL